MILFLESELRNTEGYTQHGMCLISNTYNSATRENLIKFVTFGGALNWPFTESIIEFTVVLNKKNLNCNTIKVTKIIENKIHFKQSAKISYDIHAFGYEMIKTADNNNIFIVIVGGIVMDGYQNPEIEKSIGKSVLIWNYSTNEINTLSNVLPFKCAKNQLTGIGYINLESQNKLNQYYQALYDYQHLHKLQTPFDILNIVVQFLKGKRYDKF